MYHGERFNSITHLIGVPLAGAGMAVLVVIAAAKADPWKVVSFSVYGATLITLYACSTLYHSARGRWKDLFRKLDHHAIYMLIAGTYTPFTLVTLRGAWGWTLFGVIWGLAALGIAVDSFSKRGRRIIPILIYVFMGWLCVFAFRPLLSALPGAGLAWLFAGGFFYTAGIGFFAADSRLRHAHGIWHLCVLAGSVCHYVAILFYVAIPA